MTMTKHSGVADFWWSSLTQSGSSILSSSFDDFLVSITIVFSILVASFDYSKFAK